jgi:hypothetical protein
VRVSIAGVDAAATARLGEAIEAWVASRPDGAASTRQVDEHIVFDACDRATTADTLSADLTNVPSVRAQLTVALARGGGSVDRATCVATGLIDLLPLELVMAEELSELQQQRLRDAMTEAAAICRAGG